jgi:hypothetical protein
MVCRRRTLKLRFAEARLLPFARPFNHFTSDHPFRQTRQSKISPVLSCEIAKKLGLTDALHQMTQHRISAFSAVFTQGLDRILIRTA